MDIKVNTGTPYTVTVKSNLLQNVGAYISENAVPSKIVLVTDNNVDTLYAGEVACSLKKKGFAVFKYVFKAGEKSKTIKTYNSILEFAAQNRITRADAFIALGGGICGDITGYAAATYLRGIRYIQIPTTLLAAVDSSVGGKTGVNLKEGKNLAGAFYQPSCVLFDTMTLDTLPKKEYKNGMAEIIKYGFIRDADIIKQIQTKDFDLESIILRCIKIKADIVERDEKELSERKILNFGHTVGHAIEKLSHYRIPHGMAVAKGMAVISRAENKFADEIINVEKKFGLNPQCKYKADELFDSILSDKKASGNKIDFIVPESMGQCKIKSVKINEIKEYLTKGLQ